MLASVDSAVLEGVDGRVVSVEVHVSRGLPGYTVVGLPDAAGRESRERVRAALLSSDLPYPMKRVTVNLAPASVRKAGSGLELAIALALTTADGGLPSGVLDGVGVLGELGLDGAVRPVVGALALVAALAHRGTACVIVPAANAAEAALVPGVHVRVARTLGELHACLKGEAPWPDPPEPAAATDDTEPDEPLDLADVRGLANARVALAAAAAGGHHLLLVGPPGVGKTMLARRLPTIMPDLDRDAALEVTRIHSAAGTAPISALRTRPPFRAPHHSASTVALVGGGSPRVRPGEITLAHRGALFLDEAPEFPTSVLEALRQPLEERVVRISRASGTLEFPADFLLVACANPCPCGRSAKECRCSDVQRTRYARRLSAPLLDRFDLRLRVRSTRWRARPVVGRDPGTSRDGGRAATAAPCPTRNWRRNAHIPAGALGDPRPAAGRRARRVDRRVPDPSPHRARRGSNPARRAHARRPRRPRHADRQTTSCGPRGSERTSGEPRPRVPSRRRRSLRCRSSPRRACAGCSTRSAIPSAHWQRCGRDGSRVSSAGAATRTRARSPRSGARPRHHPGSRSNSDTEERTCGSPTTTATRFAIPCPTGLRCSSARATGPTRSMPRGSRSSGPDRRRRTGSPTRASSARSSPTPASPW